MQTNRFQELTLSRLGFGMMRLPQTPAGEIDEAALEEMVDLALRSGVNYFDTAFPYHGGMSEFAAGRALSRWPRESYCLATKYPGHQIASRYDPADVFEQQLKKCRTGYFDFYLLHNVCESSYDVYTSERWGILPYFRKQKELGRIRHLGMSSHARSETLEKFLDYAGGAVEFVQIQLNYLDWTLQEAEEKYRILTERGIPVWVMEPVHGGKLAQLPPAQEAALRALAPERTPAAWAFRFLQDLPNVKMILSGMSDLQQMRENIRTFSTEEPLSPGERAALFRVAEELKGAVPCTGCRYCCDGCPAGLDIPLLIRSYNDLRFGGGFTVPMQMDVLPRDQWPDACLGCGACAAICPQGIDVPSVMEAFTEKMKTAPSWAAICKEREEAARRSRLN